MPHFSWDLREKNISIVVHIMHIMQNTYYLRDDLVEYDVEKNIWKLETPEDSPLPPGHASLLLLGGQSNTL